MKVPIITYHAVGSGPRPLWISPRELEVHLDAFASCGYRTTSLAAVAAALAGGRPLPRRCLVLTFDDGYRSVHRQALPRLAERGFTATVFLISGRCGGTNRWPGQPAAVPEAPLLGWEQAAELAAAGWELGGHSRTHRLLSGLAEEQLEEEIAGCRREIAEHAGAHPAVFAYPYGAATARVEAVVRRHFAAAAGTRLDLVRSGSHPYRLPRIDAHYLGRRRIAGLQGPPMQLYLSLRRLLRSLRRRWRSDSSSWPPEAASGV